MYRNVFHGRFFHRILPPAPSSFVGWVLHCGLIRFGLDGLGRFFCDAYAVFAPIHPLPRFPNDQPTTSAGHISSSVLRDPLYAGISALPTPRGLGALPSIVLRFRQISFFFAQRKCSSNPVFNLQSLAKFVPSSFTEKFPKSSSFFFLPAIEGVGDSGNSHSRPS